jgi:hypothetical protein
MLSDSRRAIPSGRVLNECFQHGAKLKQAVLAYLVHGHAKAPPMKVSEFLTQLSEVSFALLTHTWQGSPRKRILRLSSSNPQPVSLWRPIARREADGCRDVPALRSARPEGLLVRHDPDRRLQHLGLVWPRVFAGATVARAPLTICGDAG